jgi:hypothetical protein
VSKCVSAAAPLVGQRGKADTEATAAVVGAEG